MSTRIESRTWMPPYSWWVVLACAIATGLTGNWFLAAGVVLALVVYTARPFDFAVAYMMVTGGSTFIYYAGGNLTLQLGLLTGAIGLMLVCYVVSRRGESLALPRTSLTWPLVIYTLLSTANTVRGVIYGFAIKDILIEYAPVLSLASAFLVGNALQPKRDLGLVIFALLGTSIGSASLGYYVFSIIRTHTAGIYFHPLPGVVALLFINLALRSKKLEVAVMWTVLSLPLLLHQFLSFRRGLWLGLLAGFLSSVLIYTRGADSRIRWKRTGVLFGSVIGAGVLGAVALAVIYGQFDIIEQAAGRFASIGGTEVTRENMSNVTRLVEYATAAGRIQESPWIGHGIGYSFIVHNVVNWRKEVQWWVHENYILVWLKQGLIGLVVFLWMLWRAFWLGARNATRREDPWESSWLASTAAATAFFAAFSLSDYPFDLEEATFLVALFWGGAMAITREGFVQFRWAVPGSRLARSRVPGAGPDVGSEAPA
jgi:O-antigen ligase